MTSRSTELLAVYTLWIDPSLKATPEFKYFPSLFLVFSIQYSNLACRASLSFVSHSLLPCLSLLVSLLLSLFIRLRLLLSRSLFLLPSLAFCRAASLLPLACVCAVG